MYYFQVNGKTYKVPPSRKASSKNTNGKKFAFDIEGKILYVRVNTESERQTGDDTRRNSNENDGNFIKSKIKTNNSKKYVFSAKGKMLVGVQALAMISNAKIICSNGIGDADKVSGLKIGILKVKSYENASIKYGISDGTDSVDVYVYYFSAGSNSSLKIGDRNIDIDGDVDAFSFCKSGPNKEHGLRYSHWTFEWLYFIYKKG